MNEKDIVGRFYFKQTSNYNLIGEYSNNLSENNLSECANKVDEITEQFIGKYITTWFDNESISLDLIISHKKKSNKSIFTLNWQNRNDEIYFYGEAFLVDEILIGDYRNFELK